MKTLLKYDSSPMGERSISRMLTADFADLWLQRHPGGQFVSRNLSTLELPRVDEEWVAASATPEELRTEAQRSVLALSDRLIANLETGDEYVFGVPMHNFSIPSSLKLWIDQVARAGKTFKYTATGPVGLLTGKKATVLIASGGVVYGAEGGAPAALNFVEPYLRTVFGFMGITDVTTIWAEGTARLKSGQLDSQLFLAPTLKKVYAQATK